MCRVDNAVIMAAGTSSRFAPLSYEKPKALLSVKNEILIERQIRQLQQSGVSCIYIVTGYKAEQFAYLENKFGVHLIFNPSFLTRNNNASIYAARHVLKNSYICSADNYFGINPFELEVSRGYYSVVFSDGDTDEWCVDIGEDDLIRNIHIGGNHSWYMLGHVFWDKQFSKRFIGILEKEYLKPETEDKLWENIYAEHLDQLTLAARKYDKSDIFEFDTLDELRQFDETYVMNTRSTILAQIAKSLDVKQNEIIQITAFKGEDNKSAGFVFQCRGRNYSYSYASGIPVEIHP